MYFSKKTIVFDNGKYVLADEAKASLYTQTLHYGIGVIDGIRAYSNPSGITIFKADEHFKRLKDSATRMHMKLKYSVGDLVEISNKLLEKNNLSDAYIRPLVYNGFNMHLSFSEEVNFFMAAWKWGRYLGDRMLNITVSSFQRPHPKSGYVDAKITGNYVGSILATTEAKKKGFDEALMLDINGNVAQGPGTNVFFEKNKVLYTPPKGSILPGITRSTIIEIAREIGVEVKEKHFTVDEMTEGDSAFFTGTAAEVAGIKSIDGHRYKMDWEDSLGYVLSTKYRQLIKTGDFQHSTII